MRGDLAPKKIGNANSVGVMEEVEEAERVRARDRGGR